MQRLAATIFIATLSFGSSAWAQASTQDCPLTTNGDHPAVVSDKNQINTTTWAELNDTITIVVDGSCKWLQARKLSATGLRLYLAGHLLEGIEPSVFNLREDYLKFDLKLDSSKNRDEWVKILWTARNTPKHLINISVGYPAAQEVFQSKTFMTLNIYPKYTALVVAGLVTLLGLLLLLAAKTDLLRAVSRQTTGRPPYSLGMIQMASWFYVVVACYLFIWMITGEYNTLTEQVLSLIGISGATGLIATVIEDQKREQVVSRRKELVTKDTALTTRINEISSSSPASGSALDQELQAKKSELAQARAELASTPAPTAGVSMGWWRDILSDGDGIRFHRFQIVIWTIVLGVIFIRLVNRDLAMPQFNATLLGLMGISSGTYLGFKFPEKPK
jgi:hypothetical protein